MAGDKTYITDGNGKLHRATRTHKVTPESIVWSSNPNDYAVQVRIDGKWHRAFLTMDAGTATYFDNINIDKALVTGGDGKTHTVLICSPEASVTMSSIKTDQHSLVAGTTTGETAVNVYSETWSNVQWQDNVNVYKVLVTGSDGKVHTALLTTSVTGGVEVIIKGTSPLNLPDAIANSLSYVKAFGGTEQRNLPDGYTQFGRIHFDGHCYFNTGVVINSLTATVKLIAAFDSQTDTSPCVMWGYMGGNASLPRWGVGLYSDKWLTSANATTPYGTTDTDKHIFITELYDNSGTPYWRTYLDGALLGSGITVNSETITGNTLSTYIGARNNNGTAGNYVKGNFTYLEITQDGVCLAKIYPCKRDSDNVLGLYNTVTNEFLPNLGTGTLTADIFASPTPDAPMDIVSNNGVLKARHQSGLPLGYTLLGYIESTGGQLIDTGINDVDKVETELNMGGFGSYKAAFGNYSSEARDVTRFILSGNSSSIYPIANINSKAGGGSIGFSGQIFSVNSYHTVVMEDLVTEIRTTVDGYSKTIEKVSGAANPLSIALFANAPNGTTYAGVGFKYWRAYKNGVLVRNMIPAKNSSGVVGMYDTVSGQFFTNQGTGDFVAGATVDDIEVYADGAVETINAHGKNLFNQAFFDTDVGAQITYTTFEIPNGTYTMSTNFPYVGGTTNVFVFAGEVTSGAATTTNGVYDGQSRTITVTNGKYTVAYRSRTSASSNTNNPKDYDFQLELGSTATEYQPYYDGGTATAEMLLKVGDYQDVQSIIDGVVTRKVGVKVFDGTEGWVDIDGRHTCSAGVENILPSSAGGLCNYLPVFDPNNPSSNYIVWSSALIEIGIPGTSIADLTAWLAAQYAAGTPVIVVYPLAEPTTESVAGQTLQVTDGDNVLEITQASLTGLELEAQYNAAVSLTIQEVEDANLDNNVTVTIQ